MDSKEFDELWMSEQEFKDIEDECIQDNIESGYYRIVRSKKRFKKLRKRENVEIFFYAPINAWLWVTHDWNEDGYDECESVECHGSGSGLYDNASGSSGVYWG